MERYTHIVWDFNGTLLNDVDASFCAANALLRAHGLPQIPSLEAYRAAFGFPITDYYRRLGFDFEAVSYDALAIEWVELYRRFSATATLYPEVPALTSTVQGNGMVQIILSATHIELLEEQLPASEA